MRKTASEIEADIYQIIGESGLKNKINGSIYRDGLRPFDSQKEDIVISFLTAIEDVFYQEGKVNINLYIPDKTSTGHSRKDVKRCAEAERILLDFFQSLKVRKDYRFKLSKTIQTFKEENIDQHFTHLQLEFKYNTMSQLAN